MAVQLRLLCSWVSCFGFSLNKAGLTKYHKIVNEFRFTDMTVLKFMMTALVVAMIGLFDLRGLGLITFPTASRHLYRGESGRRADIRGRHGPDRVLTRHLCRRVRRRKIGLHRPRSAWFPDRCSDFWPDLPTGFPADLKIANLGSVVIPDLWNLNPYLTVLAFALMALLLFYLIDRAGLQRKNKDEDIENN